MRYLLVVFVDKSGVEPFESLLSVDDNVHFVFLDVFDRPEVVGVVHLCYLVGEGTRWDRLINACHHYLCGRLLRRDTADQQS